jgi:hypothetical protein
VHCTTTSLKPYLPPPPPLCSASASASAPAFTRLNQHPHACSLSLSLSLSHLLCVLSSALRAERAMTILDSFLDAAAERKPPLPAASQPALDTESAILLAASDTHLASCMQDQYARVRTRLMSRRVRLEREEHAKQVERIEAEVSHASNQPVRPDGPCARIASKRIRAQGPSDLTQPCLLTRHLLDPKYEASLDARSSSSVDAADASSSPSSSAMRHRRQCCTPISWRRGATNGNVQRRNGGPSASRPHGLRDGDAGEARGTSVHTDTSKASSSPYRYHEGGWDMADIRPAESPMASEENDRVRSPLNRPIASFSGSLQSRHTLDLGP